MSYLIYFRAEEQIHFIWQTNTTFTLKEAKEYISWAEEKFPENKGIYKIFHLTEVQE